MQADSGRCQVRSVLQSRSNICQEVQAIYNVGINQKQAQFSFSASHLILCGPAEEHSVISGFWVLLVAVGHCNPGNGSRVTAQEEEWDVAGSGHQVDQHGHADGTQSWKVQLLNQEAPQENTQTGTGDGCHT